ncbi:MAG: 23S rRNA (guanosine(2251)-2'-O)-methyltransferase RlmB [Pseudomonadota bacterium]
MPPKKRPISKPPRRDPGRHRAPPASRGGPGDAATAPLVLYGTHAVTAALDNPTRQIRRLVTLGPCTVPLAEAAARRDIAAEPLDRAAFAALVGAEAAHQGVGALVEPLPQPDLRSICNTDRSLVLVLDQVEDSRNLGAILRSAAAFGADALVMQTRHAAPLNAACAKAASGALEWVPVIHEVNLARTLTQLQGAGYWVAGLDGNGETALDAFEPAAKQVLVLGAEGRGLRPLIRERCDLRVRIPIAARPESLNVAVTAGIALCHCALRVA